MAISRGRYQGINPSDDVEPVGVKTGGFDFDRRLEWCIEDTLEELV